MVLGSERFKCIFSFSADFIFTSKLYSPSLNDAAYECLYIWIIDS